MMRADEHCGELFDPPTNAHDWVAHTVDPVTVRWLPCLLALSIGLLLTLINATGCVVVRIEPVRVEHATGSAAPSEPLPVDPCAVVALDGSTSAVYSRCMPLADEGSAAR